MDEVDFNQLDDFSATPKYVASLAHFTFNQNQFVTNLGTEQNVLSDVAPLQIKSDFIQNYLANFLIQFTVTNSFNRPITLVLRFYNANSQPILALNPITIPPNTVNKTYYQNLSGADLANFKNSAATRLDVVLGAGAPINTAISQTLNVQISGIFDFNIYH